MNKKFAIFGLLFLPLVTVTAFQEANIMPASAEDTAPVYSGQTTIYVLNVEDYIYKYDPENGYEDPNLTKQFEEYARDVLGFENPHVVYTTTPTPETMLNELQTGRANYDLICPSDYMIQRMIDLNLLDKLDGSLLPNYYQYSSVKIRQYLENCFTKYYQNPTEVVDNPYAIGYMWGTLGILFNPTYKGRNFDETCKDMQDWSILWDTKYQKTISIKDSMRDTFAVGLMASYTEDYEMMKDEGTFKMKGFKSLTQEYNAIENPSAEQTKAYNSAMSKLFNMDDSVVTSKESVISTVSQALNYLKANIYGLEVDTGKNDIVTGKIGVNLAWSGDAVYSMEKAEEQEIELCYSVPRYGSNVWFDGWCMPKRSGRTEAENALAHAFLDFLSMPENASQNMDYTGYTPFIAGDSILELARSWYDCRYDEELDDIVPLTPEDLAENEYQTVDLSYIFDGTLDEYASDPTAAIFYTNEETGFYLPYKDDENPESSNIAVGGAFFTQYPDEATINRCAVMQDFGPYNNAITKMWEKFKSSALPIWAIVIFVIEGVAAVSLILYFVLKKAKKKSIAKKRK